MSGYDRITAVDEHRTTTVLSDGIAVDVSFDAVMGAAQHPARSDAEFMREAKALIAEMPTHTMLTNLESLLRDDIDLVDRLVRRVYLSTLHDRLPGAATTHFIDLIASDERDLRTYVATLREAAESAATASHDDRQGRQSGETH